MRKTIFQRIGSGLLSLLMMSTLAISPALAADSRPEPSAAGTQAASDFTITPVGTVTADSTQVTLHIDCADPEVSTVNVFLLPVNTHGYDEDNPIAKKWSAAIGDVTLDVPAGKLTAGSRFCVKLTYTKDDDVREVFSDYFTVAAAGEKTRAEIIANTSAVLLQDGKARTEPFKQNANSVDVQVKLDNSVESCYMTVYAYIGTAGFDPDNSTSSFVLWKGQVTTGTVKCPFNTNVALKVGYKIIACVNTPAGKDAEGSTNYAYVKSQALEVVDENGQGFQPYAYPDITIDETTLEPGATTLHISMTGDQRIFDAAVAEKIDINYTIGMYPAGDEFQIEDGSTITLVQLGKTTGSITHQEVTLSQPLKAGWRVRAVAYWDGCPELFIARSNDYQLGQEDDSVLVSGTAEENIPTAAVQGTPKAGDTSVTVQLGGKIPSGAVLILRSYDADATKFETSDGTWVATQTGAEAKTYVLSPAKAAMVAGRKLVALLLSSGTVIAQSDPVIIGAAQTPGEETTVTLLESSYTTTSTQATVKVTGAEKFVGGSLFVTTGLPITENDDSRTKLGRVDFTGAGEYTVPFTLNTGDLKEGQTVQAYLFKYDSDTEKLIYQYSDAVTVTASSGVKTPEEILKNTTATLMKNGTVRTENFKQSEKSVDVKVTLDSSLNQCYMTIFAYSSNTTFDPDSSYNKRLWTGYVKNGQTVTCEFNQELPLYYNVIACLNVPVGEDFYRPSNSQALEVTDDSGEGFRDYTYPDASIVETTLDPGATKLHINLTGDERLFQAAKEGKTSLTVAVAQYPNDGTTFDFEGEKQISLASNLIFTEPQKNYEVTLSQPLKAGWRVRAVVYWQQNESIFLPKGNDYEAMFQRPDDSVLVSGTPEEDIPAVSIQGTPKAGDTSVTVQLGGKIPDGTYIVLKKYDAGTADADCVLSGGTFLSNRSASAAGEQTLTFSDALTAGEKLAAFLTNNGQLAKSQPVTVAAAQTTPLFTITPKGALAADSTQITFTVISSDPSITSVGTFLCPVKNGSVDSDHWIARQLEQKLGDITLDIPEGKLKDGDVVRLILNYEKNDDFPYYFGTEANNITVGAQVPAEDSVVLNESTFTTDATQATVTVTGCDSFQGGYLILTTGSVGTNGDADSRNRLGSVTFTGPGTYTVPFGNNHVKLISGNTIQAHLYKLDDKDRTYYKYSNAVGITSGSQPAVKPEVSIATDSITADRTNVWVQTSFDGALTGTLKLYTYTGETFAADKAKEIYSGTISSSSNSQKITFGSGKLTAGQKLIAVLDLSDGTSVKSTAKTVQAAPEKIKPAVQLVTKKVTAGMTKLYAAMTIDSSVNNASYTIYQFTGDTLDISTATALSSGTLYRSQSKETVPLGRGKLIPGAKLQIVLTADGVEARSDVLTVEPSPDWGTPYAAFNVSVVKTDAKSVSVQIDYADEYVAMGTDFYCDVTIYQFPGSYSDAEFESKELWENLPLTQRVGQINSNFGDTTRGAELTVPIKDSAKLNAGDRLIIKLRLPHTEWEGEEVDYLSASVPVVGENETVPDAKVVLYNLGEDTSRGARVRAILAELNIPAETVTAEQLNEIVGHLAGLDGYEAAGEKYTGTAPDTEFMLLCNLPEALLDKFLDAMQTDGLRIDHKAVVTAYNRDMKLHELMGDISEEHDVFQALLKLDRLIAQAENLEESTYGSAPNWEKFQAALSNAKQILSSQEPTLEQLQTARDNLKNEYLTLTGMKEMQGDLVIVLTQAADGTYTLRAELKNGLADVAYQYAWSNGAQNAEITGVTAEQLHTLQVTVSADNLLGSRTTQLQAPNSPVVTTAATSSAITLRWNAPADEDNRPAAKAMTVRLYEGNRLIKEQTADAAAGSMTLTSLSANTAYTLRIAAVSPVGRSDTQVLGVSTAKRSSGGGSSSGGGGSSSSDKTGSGKTETVTKPDGTKVQTETKPDGTKIQTVTGKDGSTATVKTDKNGQTTAETKLSAKAVEDAKRSGEAVKAPVEVKATKDSSTAPTVKVELPRNSGETKVEIPVSNVKPGTVAILVHADGTEEIVKTSLPTADGIQLTVNGSATVKIMDNSKDFADTRNHWAKDAIDFVSARGLVNGMNAVSYAPNASTTRAQLWTILARQNDADLNGGNTWFENAQNWAKEKGISDGVNPNGTINRAQMVTMLWRAMGQPAAASGASFADVPADSYYAQAVAWAIENGITAGVGGSKFDPNATCTRAQIATFLYRYMK
jgi:methionine-rich copper-binding protein CopC